MKKTFSLLAIFALFVGGGCSSQEVESYPPVEHVRQQAFAAFQDLEDREDGGESFDGDKISFGYLSERQTFSQTTSSSIVLKRHYVGGYSAPRQLDGFIRTVAGLKVGTVTATYCGDGRIQAEGHFFEAKYPDAMSWALAQMDSNGDLYIEEGEVRQNYQRLMRSFAQ